MVRRMITETLETTLLLPFLIEIISAYLLFRSLKSLLVFENNFWRVEPLLLGQEPTAFCVLVLPSILQVHKGSIDY
jgi:hypothetical protein